MSRFKEVVAARTALELLIDSIRNPHGAQEAMSSSSAVRAATTSLNLDMSLLIAFNEPAVPATTQEDLHVALIHVLWLGRAS